MFTARDIDKGTPIKNNISKGVINEINFFMSKLLNHKDAFRITHCTNSFKEQTTNAHSFCVAKLFDFEAGKKF